MMGGSPQQPLAAITIRTLLDGKLEQSLRDLGRVKGEGSTSRMNPAFVFGFFEQSCEQNSYPFAQKTKTLEKMGTSIG